MALEAKYDIQALVDGKKVIVTKTSVRRALQLKDAEGTESLPNATIFAELERMGPYESNIKEGKTKTRQHKFLNPVVLQCITDEAANSGLVYLVKKPERRNKSRTLGLKRLQKVGRSAQVVSFEDEEVTLVDEARERNDDNLMFDTGVLDKQEVETLIEIKAAKPKAVTTTATTTTTVVTRPKARGVVVQEPNQILVDEKIAQRLQEELQAELEEEERLARQKEEEDNLISWDNIQAMMEADYELAQRLQVEEQGELTIKERLKLFVELMDKRKKHFAKLRVEEIRRKPPTKAQKRNQMCTYLKNIANYKHSQRGRDRRNPQPESFKKRHQILLEGRYKGGQKIIGSKRIGEELESDNSKKQKIDENVEAKVDDEAKMKKHMEIVPNDEVAINAIPLATKSPIIVDWKIIKEGKIGYFQIIRGDGSLRRITTARRVSAVRRIKKIERFKMKIVYQDYLWDKIIKFEPKYNKVKAKLALIRSSASAPSSSSSKNKGLIAKLYDWDEQEVSSDDNEVPKVKALMVLANEERVSVSKENARNSE
ncbi:hypothetical protein Tco_0922371 [Tanacetum coccineum]|uniref:Uncharacterized protein n=1 Tax=Tanacetum coccineum TaxID=301880 RepID=A0ABQ5D0Q7_9ASTR